MVRDAAAFDQSAGLRLQFHLHRQEPGGRAPVGVEDGALRQMAAHPWFGLGLGTFGGTSAVRFGYGDLWVDNFYLQLAAEGGLIVLGLFLWILLRGARAGQGSRDHARPLSAGTGGRNVRGLHRRGSGEHDSERMGDPRRRRWVLVPGRPGDLGRAARGPGGDGGAQRHRGPSRRPRVRTRRRGEQSPGAARHRRAATPAGP